MPYNGSGVFSLIYNWQNDAAQGINISSSRMMGQENDIASALSDCVTRDGQSPPTANLPMGSFQFTNMGNASAQGNATSVLDVQNGTVNTLTTVTGTDTITATTAPAIAAYAAGQAFDFLAAGSNATSAVTLNLNGLGAKTVTKNGTAALSIGDLQNGQSYRIRYDGTRFQIVSPLATSTVTTSFRNKLINGNFDNWQRAVSNSFTAAGGYVSDQWISNSGIGGAAACNIARNTFVPGTELATQAPTTYVMNFVQTGAANSVAPSLTQRIESVRTLANGMVALSFIAYVTSGTLSVQAAMVQFFGTGGSPSASVFSSFSSVLLTTTPQKFTVVTSLPGISGKTLGTNGDDSLWLQFTFPANATFNLVIAQVQLEAGATVTPFESRPLELELALCQRSYVNLPAISLTTATTFSQTLPVVMRATPAVSATFSNGSGGGYSMLTNSLTGQSNQAFFQSTGNSLVGTATVRFDASL